MVHPRNDLNSHLRQVIQSEISLTTEGLRGSTSENCHDASRESVLEARIEESERQISCSQCVESYKYC